MTDRPPRWADAAALALLVLLTLFFFWRLVAPNPADRVSFPVGDFTDQYYPLRAFAARAIADGQIPMWNPFHRAGVPALADPQAAILYPPAQITAILSSGSLSLTALMLETVAHILLAAWGSYAFVRVALRLGPLAALVGAITFAFSGYLTGYPLEQVTIVESVAWLPWLLLGLSLAGQQRTGCWWGSALAAIALGMSHLAGFPQTALYLTLLAMAYALFRFFQGERRTWRSALALFLPIPLGIGLAAAQLLPTFAFAADSSREGVSYAFVQQGLAWEELTTTILPNIISSTPLYVGILTLALALLAWGESRQRPEKIFWAVVALFSLLLAFGGASALFDALYLTVPGLGRVRRPERALLLWLWALSLLAAWGTQALASHEGRTASERLVRRAITLAPPVLLPWFLFWWLRATAFSNIVYYRDVYEAYFARYTFFLLMALLSLLALTAIRRQPSVRWLILPLLVLDLFSINRPFHIGPPLAEALRPANSVVAALQARLPDDPGRIAIAGAVTPRDNDGMRWELPLLSSNEPLQLAISDQALGVAHPWAQRQMTGAQYLVADHDLAIDAPDAYERLVSDPDGSVLLRVRPPMPYAWLVGAEALVSADDLPARLADPAFDPHRTALLAGTAAQPLADPADSTLAVVARGPGGEIRVENRADGPIRLVIAEPAASGWQLALDGTAVGWQRANGWNLSLRVPPGSHTVALAYAQPGWALGRLISGIALLGLVTLLLWPLLARRRAA